MRLSLEFLQKYNNLTLANIPTFYAILFIEANLLTMEFINNKYTAQQSQYTIHHLKKNCKIQFLQARKA